MNITESLEFEHSNQQATNIASYVETHPSALKELMNCFFSEEYRICQRASWPIGKLADRQPELLIPYLPQMIKHIENPVHDAAIRNTIKLLQFVKIPEDLLGNVYEKCFKYLIDPKIPAAIRVFSMTVLVNISTHYRELIPELILAIEDQLPHGSAGIKSRGKKELQRLRKLT